MRDVLSSFQKFEAAFPRAAREQTLVTPRLPPTVSWLARDPSRVRRARPFYAPFSDVAAASDQKLRADLIDAYGAELGAFVAESVEVAERNLPDRDNALQAFRLALERAFSSLDLNRRQIEAAFDALSGLAMRSIGHPLARAELERTIAAALGEPFPPALGFPLHIRSDRNEADETSLEIDASAFSGGGAPYPDPAHWGEGLLAPLDRTARWLRARGVSRIALGGSYRLSTAFAVGWSFRSAIGFEIDIPTRDGSWRTDDRPGQADALPWRIVEPSSLHGDQLVICIGVLRDLVSDVSAATGASAGAILYAHLSEPLVSGRAAQASVSRLKREVDSAVGRLRPSGIKLYLAGPAALAVVLGHRWNAVPRTQLHEFLATERRYVPTVCL